MSKYTLTLSILTAAALLLVSCSSRPDYDEKKRASIDEYYKKMQSRAVISKPLPTLPKESIYLAYEGTKLNLTDNRDYNPNADYTSFVTRYDPETKVNVGPGHVSGKTKWCPICNAEVSISEQEDRHRHWKDEKTGKQVHTTYSYLEGREVGPNHVFKKTKWNNGAKREVVEEDYDEGMTPWCPVCKAEAGPRAVEPDGSLSPWCPICKTGLVTTTQWCPVCKAEAGPGHDHDFTRYCSTCQKDVAKWRHEFKGGIHYGHSCGITSYSKTWMVGMLNKDAKTYEKVPNSRIDYALLDKQDALVHPVEPRIYEPEPPPDLYAQDPGHVLPGVPWVEDRAVKLDKILSEVKWEWKNPKAEKMTFELAPRKVSDVAQDAIDYTEKARNPEIKWAEEKEKEKKSGE
jgi:thiol-disulfide isomerase/thioredoxin